MASKFSLSIGSNKLGIAVMLATVLATVGAQAGFAQSAPAPSSANQSAASDSAASDAVAQTFDTQYFEGREVEPIDVRPLPTVPQAFNSAYYNRRGNYFDNRQIWQSFSLILGIPSFPEQAISNDGRTIHRLYNEVLEQQIASDPILRTPDLPNPYTGSILTTPLVITEDTIEPAPAFPPIRRPSAEPAPSAPASRPAAPVPALW